MLRAGPLTVELSGADLRYARSSRTGNEVMRRLYLAVRDLDWNTLPLATEPAQVEDGGDAFRVRLDGRSTEGEIDFRWSVKIVGERDGTVSYELDGKAARSFEYAKIGLCIHHPLRESVGRLFRGEASDTPIGGELPRNVGPQIHVPAAGFDLPLFDPAWWFDIDLPRDECVRFDFEGSPFEMEDQRNWTDGSFKSASTPASLGYHHTAKRGKRIRQRVTFRLEGSAATPRRRRPRRCEVCVGEPTGRALPPVGLGAASDGGQLSGRERRLLRALAPAHMRVDVRPGELERLSVACADAQALRCPIELALFLNGASGFAREVADALGDTPLARVLVFDDDADVSPLDELAGVRRRFPGVPVGGGTNAHFAELNRIRPDPERFDLLAWSATPQVHASDEPSLVESLEAQGDTVRSARAFAGSTPLALTPITLRPRFNADAVVAESDDADGLPRAVDPRQMSLFAAAWTVGSVSALASAGVSSATYFETAGWRGVLERDRGAPTPAFPSLPGETYPVYHVLRDVCAWRARSLLACEVSDPLAIAALAVEGGLLIANLRPKPQTIALHGLAGASRVRRLSHRTTPRDVQAQATAPESLRLAPFEVVRIDVRRPRRRQG